MALGKDIDYRQLAYFILDALPFVLLLRNTQGQFVLLNRYACDNFFGNELAEKILGRTLTEISDSPFSEQVLKEDQAILKSGQLKKSEERYIYTPCRNQECMFDVYKIPLHLSEDLTKPSHVLSILIDVTKARQNDKAQYKILETAIKIVSQSG